MHDPQNSAKKDDVDIQVDKMIKVLTIAAGYNPLTCTEEQKPKIRNDNGEIRIDGFSQGSLFQVYEQIKMIKLLEFFIAVQKKDLDKIKDLIERKLVENIDVENPMPMKPMSPTTALGIAISQGDSEEIVKYLTAKGADPKLAFNDFKTTGDINGISQLIKIAPNVVEKEIYESEQISQLRLLAAVEKQDLDTIKDLIEKKLVDINAKIPMFTGLINPTTALSTAINQESSEEIIDFLLANGANPRIAFDDLKKARDISGLQLLDRKSTGITSVEIHEAIIQIGFFGFLKAVEVENLTAVKAFIEKKLVDINAKSPENGKTALKIAYEGNNKEIIDYLLANGAEDNAVEHLGDSNIFNPE